MITKNIDELLADAGFREKIDSMSNDEITELFTLNGIDAEIDDAAEGEIDEAALERVVGGCHAQDLWRWIKVKGRIIKIKQKNNFGIGGFDGGGGGRGF